MITRKMIPAERKNFLKKCNAWCDKVNLPIFKSAKVDEDTPTWMAQAGESMGFGYTAKGAVRSLNEKLQQQRKGGRR